MAFVHHQQKVLGEVVQQGGGSGTGCTAGQHCRVVLDALAHANFLQHFHVIFGALGNTLSLNEFSLLREEFDLLLHLLVDFHEAFLHLFRPDDVVTGREDGHMAYDVAAFPGQGVKLADTIDLISEELHPDGKLIVVGQMNIYNVSPHTEFVAYEVHIVALILQLDQTAAEFIPLHLHPGAQTDDHAAVIDRVAQRVDTGNAGHNDHIALFRQCSSSRMPQTVNFIIDGAVLFNIGVRGRDIRFRLIVIVVGDKILHRIIREETAHLGTDLGCQGLVGLQNQGRTVTPGNDVGHGEGLAGTGHAQKRLPLVPCFNSSDQCFYSLRLVTRR